MMDFFAQARRVAVVAIPLGIVGAMLVAVGSAVDTSALTVLGIVLLIGSGGMWALHGVAEDRGDQRDDG